MFQVVPPVLGVLQSFATSQVLLMWLCELLLSRSSYVRLHLPNMRVIVNTELNN